MLIPIVLDRNVIRVNRGFAEAVPEFADVLNDETLGERAMAYVAYVCDPADDNIWFALPDEIRTKEVAESLGLEKGVAKDKKVQLAIKKYKAFCENSITYKFKSSYNEGMKKLSDYISSVGKLDDETAKNFAAVLDKMPALLKGKEDLDKMGTKEAHKSKVRGEKKLTLNER